MIINFYGGAGCGKSTVASYVFSQLRMKKYSAELATETIKSWAYQGRVCKSFDQLFIFASQLHAIDFYLQHGVKYVVSDSPILMQCTYTLKSKSKIHNELLSIAKKFQNSYPTIDIFLDRTNIPYEKIGRYESYEEACQLDRLMRRFLKRHIRNLLVVDATRENVFEIVHEEIKKYDLNSKRRTNRSANKERVKRKDS